MEDKEFMIELTEKAIQVLELVKQYESVGVNDCIKRNVTDIKGDKTMEELTATILKDPEDLQWVYDDGYFYYEVNKDLYRDHPRQFNDFKKYLAELIEKRDGIAIQLNELVGD